MVFKFIITIKNKIILQSIKGFTFETKRLKTNSNFLPDKKNAQHNNPISPQSLYKLHRPFYILTSEHNIKPQAIHPQQTQIREKNKLTRIILDEELH